MKRIISIVLIGMIIVSCGRNKLKVNIDEELSNYKEVIMMWQKNCSKEIKFIDEGFLNGDLFYNPDIIIEYKTNSNNKTGIITYGKTYNNNPIIIEIFLKHSNIIAHEFGHALGSNHNENTDSIMHANASLNRDLKTFNEFK